MDRIDGLRAFLAVADEGSFKKAADRLDMSSQLVSKYVSQLEQSLKARLFYRTTRRVGLTEAGQQCQVFAEQILESFQDMQGQLGQMQSKAQGLIRVSAPVSFATRHMVNVLRDFKLEYPDVGIDLQLNDRKVDLVDEGFDIALRIGHLQSSSLIAKRIAPIKLVLCASPDYLKTNGVPQQPEDLNPQHYLRYSYLGFNEWDSRLSGALKRAGATALSSNNGEVLLAAALSGEGYALQPTFIVGDAIKEGLLDVILKEFSPPEMALYAVYPHRKLLPTKLRVFIDFLSSYFGECPYWD